MDDSEFTLEVSSPGLDRPLTQERHWKKNLTRLIKVISNDGTELIGRLKEYDEVKATLIENIKGREKSHVVAFADIKRAVVEVEFNRKGELS
jgi:ribosome maturation factor RimP